MPHSIGIYREFWRAQRAKIFGSICSLYTYFIGYFSLAARENFDTFCVTIPVLKGVLEDFVEKGYLGDLRRIIPKTYVRGSRDFLAADLAVEGGFRLKYGK